DFPGDSVWRRDLGLPWTSPVEPTVVFLNLGSAQPANPMPATAPYVSQQVDAELQYIITRDTTFNPLSFDPEQRNPWGRQWHQLRLMIDDSPNIAGFVERGGK